MFDIEDDPAFRELLQNLCGMQPKRANRALALEKLKLFATTCCGGYGLIGMPDTKFEKVVEQLFTHRCIDREGLHSLVSELSSLISDSR